MPETIGFIGLGLMGRPMAKNLLKRGYGLVVHSRSPGPSTSSSPPAPRARPRRRMWRAGRRGSSRCCPIRPDVEKVVEGPDGVFSAHPAGDDRHRHEQHLARRGAAAGRARARAGGGMLDAPVSGGEIGAINATLSIMVGGDAGAFDAVKPILEAMGNPERIVRIGEAGAGQMCKVCNQMVIGGTLAAVSEAFALARKAGVDPAKVREALLGGFAASRVLEVHGERILNGNYKPGFRAKLYGKDYRDRHGNAGCARGAGARLRRSQSAGDDAAGLR